MFTLKNDLQVGKCKLDSQVNVDLRISKIIKFQDRYDLQDFQDLGFDQWFQIHSIITLNWEMVQQDRIQRKTDVSAFLLLILFQGEIQSCGNNTVSFSKRANVSNDRIWNSECEEKRRISFYSYKICKSIIDFKINF